MKYNGKDCDFLTLRADSMIEMDQLIKVKARGREVANDRRHRVTSKQDGKQRIIAQVLVVRSKDAS